jgi:hypothetical protein
LPQRRQACLLRSGMEEINRMINEVDKYLEEEASLLSKPIVEASSSSSSSRTDKTSKRKSAESNRKKKSGSASVGDEKIVIDYGMNEEWIHSKDICVEKRIVASISASYNYKFCFFGSAMQDNTLLGKFAYWGNQSTAIVFDDPTSRGISSIFGSGSNRATSTAGKMTVMKSQKSANMYTQQFYSRGARCFHTTSSSSLKKKGKNKAIAAEEDDNQYRCATISFQCSEVNDIIQVIETEVSRSSTTCYLAS